MTEGGFSYGPGVFGTIARRLDEAGRNVESTAPAAPSAPDAGLCTAAVAAHLGLLTESLAGIVEGLGGAANAVLNTREVYEKAEKASVTNVTPQGIRPWGS